MNKYNITEEKRELIKLRIDIDTAIKKIERLVNDKLLTTIEHERDVIKEACFHDYSKGAYILWAGLTKLQENITEITKKK